MDNLAHTLVGLALAESGLKRRSALGGATLVIGANLPDVDGVMYFLGSGADALAFRRGWTHGVLAMVLLPPLLVAGMLAWDRLVRRRHRRGAREPVHAGALLALAVIGIWSHPLLDLLNTYGVRLLMPFSGQWFYGDALFIIDPWVWLVLAAGVIASRRRAWQTGRISLDAARDVRWGARPARAALGLIVAYMLAMAAAGELGRGVVARHTGVAARTMVAPVPLNPFRRAVVRDLGTTYESGTLAWGWPAHYTRLGDVPVGRDVEGVAAAAQTEEGAAFLAWSRFPRFTSERVGDSLRVRMSDVRYADARGRGWASVVVTVPAPAATDSAAAVP